MTLASFEFERLPPVSGVRARVQAGSGIRPDDAAPPAVDDDQTVRGTHIVLSQSATDDSTIGDDPAPMTDRSGPPVDHPKVPMR